jgi:large subunit ribosomal protein L33
MLVPFGALASTFHQEVAMPRDKIILACSECKNRNYFTTKNKRLHPERVEWKKYCPRCNKHLVHKETK